MRWRWLHWLVIIALALHLASCIFTGQSFMPGAPY